MQEGFNTINVNVKYTFGYIHASRNHGSFHLMRVKENTNLIKLHAQMVSIFERIYTIVVFLYCIVPDQRTYYERGEIIIYCS